MCGIKYSDLDYLTEGVYGMRRRTLSVWVYVTMVGLLIAVSIMAAAVHSFLGYGLMAATLLIFVRIIPCSRKHENIWMFFLVTVCTIPMNITLIHRYTQIFEMAWIWRLLIQLIVYLILFSAEELIMGVITRSLWTQQYELSCNQREN